MTIQNDSFNLKKLFEFRTALDHLTSPDPDDTIIKSQVALLKRDEELRKKKESVTEADDPFPSADPDVVKSREDLASSNFTKKKIEQDAALMANAMQGEKVPLFAVIIDQGDISFDKIGYFWYNEDEDLYLEDVGKEARHIHEIVDEYMEEFYSDYIGLSVEIVTRGDLESIRDEITNIISHEARPIGER